MEPFSCGTVQCGSENQGADAQAKLGVARHSTDEVVLQCTSRLAGLIDELGKYRGRVALKVGGSVQRDSEAKTVKSVRFAPDPRRAARADSLASARHSLQLISGRLRCTVCLRSASSRSII